MSRQIIAVKNVKCQEISLYYQIGLCILEHYYINIHLIENNFIIIHRYNLKWAQLVFQQAIITGYV